MAFTATIQSIQPVNEQFQIAIQFADSASGWTYQKSYYFPFGTLQADAVAAITADGTLYKASLAQNNNLQSKVGTVITI